MTLPANHFIAIAGNPNSGKTTAFNRYTGARQHVGNYPGITVEQKQGYAHLDGIEISLVDLPGTYSLTAYSMEEVVARRVLADDRPGAVIDVINTGVLERNLYLSVQMMEMGIPLVLALNMMDEAKAHGIEIDYKQLEQNTGLPCVPMIARKGDGLDEALRSAVELAKKTNGRIKPLELSFGPDIDAALLEMTPIIEEAKLLTDRHPARWIATKFLEADEDVISLATKADRATTEKLNKICSKVATHLNTTAKTYPEAIIADYRYGWIHSVLSNGVLKGADELMERTVFSDKLDLVLTHKVAGPVILIAVLYAMYFLTIEIGNYPLEWINSLFDWLHRSVGSVMSEGPLNSLITDGIIAGVGGVLSFVPLIMIMFMFLAVLEDSGYMARVAYIMDRIFRLFGLHGASIMPFIIAGGIAGGCAVPGVMGARTLRSPKERLATILTAPFMTCGAKIPVFLLFVGVFFQDNRTSVLFLVTLSGWAVALIVARILRWTIIKGEPTPFVMELPPYRYPVLSGVLIHTWERTWQYIKKAGTVILGISILLWAAMTYPGLTDEAKDNYISQREVVYNNSALTDEQKEEQIVEINNTEAKDSLDCSLAGKVGKAVAPLTALSGFDWQTNIALIGGVAAKEVVISTLGTAYSLGEVDADASEALADKIKKDSHWTKANAISLMIFTLLYSPCFVTLMVIKRETGKWRWTFFSLFFNLALALALSTVAYQMFK
ncbi:MAG: ferrous iron transport protein B [Deltaproteobacteria bacterium]|jgi:ferrous iron transport protein B|nr:ferrous iron transport protein B [Deltaproteobacteria bacterium]